MNVDGSIDPIVDSLQSYATQYRKASSDVASPGSIDQLKKRIDELIAQLMKEKSTKPFAKKFKVDFQKLMVNAKPTFQMARTLEKKGQRNSKKQLTAFRLKLTVR